MAKELINEQSKQGLRTLRISLNPNKFSHIVFCLQLNWMQLLYDICPYCVKHTKLFPEALCK